MNQRTRKPRSSTLLCIKQVSRSWIDPCSGNEYGTWQNMHHTTACYSSDSTNQTKSSTTSYVCMLHLG